MKHSKKWLAELDKACPVHVIQSKDRNGYTVFFYHYCFTGESISAPDAIYKTRRGAKMARAKDPRVLEFFKCAD